MADKSTIGIAVDWINTGINWIKKGLRRGQVDKIDAAVSSHNVSAVNSIVQSIEKNRSKRTNAS